MMEINLGGCMYNYDNKENKFTLYYSHNDSWREDLKGKKAFEIQDFGNGICINPKLTTRKTMDYSEAIMLFFLLSEYYKNER